MQLHEMDMHSRRPAGLISILFENDWTGAFRATGIVWFKNYTKNMNMRMSRSRYELDTNLRARAARHDHNLSYLIFLGPPCLSEI